MPSDRWSLELRARRSPEQRCAFCHGGIGASATACLGCQTIFHQDCAADHGKCPTLGCTGRAPPAAIPTATLADEEGARSRRLLAALRLWARLLVRATLLSAVGVPLLVAGLFLLLSGTAWWLLGVVALAASYFVLRALERERRFQNEVRAALREPPVVLRVFTAYDGEGPRVDLRAVDADPIERAALRLRFGLAGPPGWLTEAGQVRLYGLSAPGAVVLEDAGGRRHFAPSRFVERGTPTWRREI